MNNIIGGGNATNKVIYYKNPTAWVLVKACNYLKFFNMQFRLFLILNMNNSMQLLNTIVDENYTEILVLKWIRKISIN